MDDDGEEQLKKYVTKKPEQLKKVATQQAIQLLPGFTLKLITTYERDKRVTFNDNERLKIINIVKRMAIEEKKLDIDDLINDEGGDGGLTDIFTDALNEFDLEHTLDKMSKRVKMEGKKSSSSWLCLSIFT
jgi:hypothetical protein